MSVIDSYELYRRFTLGDALRRSAADAGVTAQQMADYLGNSRFTVGRWLNDHNVPSTSTLRLWALRTGVPYEWLCQVRDEQLPRLDSNQQPSGYRFAQVVEPALRIAA